MEFVLLGLIVLSFPIVAIVALVRTVGLSDRLRRIEIRFQELETRLASATVPPAATAAAAPPPPQPAPFVAATAPPPTPPPPQPATPPEPVPPAPEPELEPAVAAAAQPAAPEISFEERFGTRWVVW